MINRIELSLCKKSLVRLGIISAALAVWETFSRLNIFPKAALPSPIGVLAGFGEEIRSGRMFDDLVASLLRAGHWIYSRGDT